MAQIRLHTLSGFMELLPEDQKKMQRVMATLRESYALYGFTPLDTPVIERDRKTDLPLHEGRQRSCPPL